MIPMVDLKFSQVQAFKLQVVYLILLKFFSSILGQMYSSFLNFVWNMFL